MPVESSTEAPSTRGIIHLPPLPSSRTIGPHVGSVDEPTPFVAPRDVVEQQAAQPPRLPNEKVDPKEIINGTVAEVGRKLSGKILDAVTTLWAPFMLLGITALGIIATRTIARRRRTRDYSASADPIEFPALQTSDAPTTKRGFGRR